MLGANVGFGVGFRVHTKIGHGVGFGVGRWVVGTRLGFGVGANVGCPKLVLLETQQSLLSPTSFGVSVMVDQNLHLLEPHDG